MSFSNNFCILSYLYIFHQEILQWQVFFFQDHAAQILYDTSITQQFLSTVFFAQGGRNASEVVTHLVKHL